MEIVGGRILKKKLSAIQSRGYNYPILSTLVAKLEYAAAKGATSVLKVTVEAIVKQSRVERIGSLIDTLPMPGLFTVMNSERGDVALVGFDIQLVDHVVDILAGGEPNISQSLPARTPTAIDVALCTKLIGSIINYASGEIRDSLISYLETEDPEFAEETERNMFTFPDIEMPIRRQDVSAIVHTVEYQTPIKALAGAEKNAPDAKKYILANISSRMAEAIGQEIREAGIVRRKDADVAQSEVIKVIRQLEQSGEITLVKDDEK